MRKLTDLDLWVPFGDKKNKKVKCLVCSHYCVISPGKLGFCRTRINEDGKLFTLIYGSCISRGSVDPVEKKPLYHFWPGSNAYSIATIGCNFRCKHCQNWEISQSYPDTEGNFAHFSKKNKEELKARSFPLTKLKPEQVVAFAKRSNSKLIAYTYNEPTIWFEFIKDTALLAKKEGLKNVLVTNGYSSIEANKKYINFIDAANIDIKAFTDRFYKEIVGVPSLKPVLKTAKFFKENGIHVEITNLIIPGENDDLKEIKQMLTWIINNLGKDTPLHFSAYTARYRLQKQSTSSNILIKARNIALDLGLQNVFLGNVFLKEGSDSICPNCNAILISREGHHVKNLNLSTDNTCRKCGIKTSIKGNFEKSKRTFLF